MGMGRVGRAGGSALSLMLAFIAIINSGVPVSSALAPGAHSKERRAANVNFRQKEKQILDTVLGQGKYDRRIRPSGINDTDGKSSTIVYVNVYLRSINDIHDYKMEFSVQITFREQWNDERLQFDDLGGQLRYLTLTDPQKVWMPDTFFRNEKTGHFHSILVNNVYVRVFPNGDVLFSIRISLTLSCPMNLKLYPMDRQTCSMTIASYGYTTDDITYEWKAIDPVQIAQGLSLPRFSIEKYSSSYCNVKTNTGEYSCLSVDLVFKRQFSYYLITIYVPGCMLVIVSWVSFWLDPHAVPARVTLGVTTLLTMSTQTASINTALPPVAYTKAIDVWQGVCVTFVFSALLEYALVNYALRADLSYLQRHANRRRDAMDDEDSSHPRQRSRTAYHYRDEDDDGGGAARHKAAAAHDDDVTSEDDLDTGDYLFADHFAVHRRAARRNRQRPESSRAKRERNLLLSSFEAYCKSHPHVSVNGASRTSSLQLASATPLWRRVIRRMISWLPFNTNNNMEKAKRIDVISRFVFPLVFAVFNVSYWSTYLTQAQAEYELTQKLPGKS